jgi:hypothetical protein
MLGVRNLMLGRIEVEVVTAEVTTKMGQRLGLFQSRAGSPVL